MTDKARCLERLSAACQGIDWVITGGLAVAAHTGNDRDVDDVDVILRTSAIDTVAGSLGLAVMEDKVHDQGRITTRQQRYAGGTVAGVPVELMAGLSRFKVEGEWYEIPVSDVLFDAAVTVGVDGQEVPIVPPEEVLIQKTVLSREKDWEDVSALLEACSFDRELLDWLLQDWGIESNRFEQMLSAGLGRQISF